jgi:hypothetical protein
MKAIAKVFLAGVVLVTTSSVHAGPALATQTGNGIGLSLSSYQYQEPGLMSNKGAKLGLDFQTTAALREKLWVRGDFRGAFGSVDYMSPVSGYAHGQSDWYFETRGLVGKDWWAFDEALLSPYVGLGYRYLASDARGVTSAGAVGYRRESNYVYLPLGLSYLSTLEGKARLVTEVEYDYLLLGKQYSKLSDTGFGYSDVTNNQNSGYGLKLSIKYEKDNWAIGPYANYWNIGKSDNAFVYQNGTPVLMGSEPKNNTLEFGLKASQQF